MGALFAGPHDSHQFRIWRRSIAAANHARTAFLAPSSVRRKGTNESNEAVGHSAAKGPLKDAIQWQKAAWAAYERSLASGSAEAVRLQGVWLEPIARVRRARSLVHAQVAPKAAAV